MVLSECALTLIVNNNPIPRIDDLFDQLQGASYFLTIDLRSGYHQLKSGIVTFQMQPSKLGMVIMNDFGLTNAPASFMYLVNRVFKTHLDLFVIILLMISSLSLGMRKNM